MKGHAGSTLARILITSVLSASGCLPEESAVVDLFPAVPVSGFLGSEGEDAEGSVHWREVASQRLGCDPCDTWIDESSGTEYLVMPRPVASLSTKEIESARLVKSVERNQETVFTIILVLTHAAAERLESVASNHKTTLNRLADRSESLEPLQISRRWYSVATFKDPSQAEVALKSLGAPYAIEEEAVDVEAVDRRFQLPEESAPD